MKIKYIALGPCGFDQARNIAYAKGLGLPYVASGALGGSLAVIGGGPSINDHVNELRSLGCDIWAVNGAYPWCVEHGIDATFFSADCNPTLIGLAKDARRAIVSTDIDISVFDRLISTGCDIRLFETGVIAGVHTGPTSVASIPALAVHMGYIDITFYGCEGSYKNGATHAYSDDSHNPWRASVECGGETFETEVEYHMQCMYLASCIRAAPHVFKERSGGLLSAMARHEDYDVIAVSPELKAVLEAA